MERQKPWYRHLWFWLIMLPPAASVVAGLALVGIAHKGADEVIRDDFVKEGLAMREDSRKRDAAAALGLSATVHLQRAEGRATVILRGLELAPQPALVLRLVHPTDSRHDRAAPLVPQGNLFRAEFEQAIEGRWGIQIEPEGEAWRLSGELAAQASGIALGTGS